MGNGRVLGVVGPVALVVAGVAYSSWILDLVRPTGHDRLRSFLSVLAEDGSPDHLVYRYGDVITAIAVLVAAGALVAVLHPTGRTPRIALAALAAFGAATLADALAPMNAMPVLHAITSAVAVFAMFVTIVAVTVAARRGQAWPPMATWGKAVAAVVVLATAWMLGADRLPGDWLLGLAQRIQVGSISVWLIVWGVVCWKRPRGTGD